METVTYTVRQGNTLFGIAQFFGTTVENILRYNNIQDPNRIFVGQTLVIPTGEEEVGGYKYVTRPGDTLWSIAQRYGTTVESIKAKNGIANPNIIYPGTILIL